ncbi:MAG: NAD(P)H-binding protein [Myxococcota bacterium]
MALRIFVAGASGYIGRHVARELARRGHEVVAFVRPRASHQAPTWAEQLEGCDVRQGEVTDASSLAREGFGQQPFSAVVSCLASRSGAPDDAERVDYRANHLLLEQAMQSGASHFLYVSAICVQKPRLAFQRAKLRFEAELRNAPLAHTIIRPTAFFKSLAGQVERVRRGKPFLVFGDGALTRCCPVGERDLAAFLADCLEQRHHTGETVAVGGPGPPTTPREQGELLAAAFDRPPRLRSVPVWLFDGAILALAPLGRVSSRLAAKAEFARIGRYYATESMLPWDPVRQRYTETGLLRIGEETLRSFYERLAREGSHDQGLGEHALFDRA